MDGITREELNGVGGRVTKMQLEVAAMSVKVERNSDDIQDIFAVSANIQKSVDRGKWQVLAMVAIPVAILTFKLLIK